MKAMDELIAEMRVALAERESEASKLRAAITALGGDEQVNCDGGFVIFTAGPPGTGEA